MIVRPPVEDVLDDVDQLVGHRLSRWVHPEQLSVGMSESAVSHGHVVGRQSVPVWRQIGAVGVEPGVQLDAALMRLLDGELERIPEWRRSLSLNSSQKSTRQYK